MKKLITKKFLLFSLKVRVTLTTVIKYKKITKPKQINRETNKICRINTKGIRTHVACSYASLHACSESFMAVTMISNDSSLTASEVTVSHISFFSFFASSMFSLSSLNAAFCCSFLNAHHVGRSQLIYDKSCNEIKDKLWFKKFYYIL